MLVLQLLVVHCSICILTLYFLSAPVGRIGWRQSCLLEDKLLCPQQVSWGRSNCEMQQLISLMENSCIKFYAADCDISTGSTEEEQCCCQRGWTLNHSFNVSQLQELQRECSGKLDTLLSSDSLSIICPFILLHNLICSVDVSNKNPFHAWRTQLLW